MNEQKGICDGCIHQGVCKHVEELENLSRQVERIRSDGMSDIFRVDVFCKQIEIKYQSK